MKITLDLYGFRRELEISIYDYRSGQVKIILQKPMRVLLYEIGDFNTNIEVNTLVFHEKYDGIWRPN